MKKLYSGGPLQESAYWNKILSPQEGRRCKIKLFFSDSKDKGIVGRENPTRNKRRLILFQVYCSVVFSQIQAGDFLCQKQVQVKQNTTGSRNSHWKSLSQQFPRAFVPTAGSHLTSSGHRRGFTSVLVLLRSSSKHPMFIPQISFLHRPNRVSCPLASRSSSLVSFLLRWTCSFSAQ